MVDEQELRRLAWHDIVCPAGAECEDRDLHASSEPIVNAGILDRYHDRLQDLRRIAAHTSDEAQLRLV